MNNINSKNKSIEALNLSSEILKNIELSKISLEKVCLKCSRLARLCGDSDYEKAFRIEILGYGNFSNGIPPNILKIGKLANRVDNKGQIYFKKSISEIETMKKLEDKKFEKPSTLAVTEILSQNIININKMLSNRMDFIYSYVSKKFHELSFEKEVYFVLSNLADFIKNNISNIIPEGGKKITSIIENLRSNNSQDWKNVLVTCRNLLKETAETLKPEDSSKRYYDILKSIVKNSSLSDKDKLLLEQDITALIDPLNEGAHDKDVYRQTAEELFIRTCLILSKIIELNQKIQKKK